MLKNKLFGRRHQKTEKAFTRNRKLPFTVVFLLILQKSIKSLQLRLNEFFDKLGAKFITASAAAFTKARAKLTHTAFIELNREAIVKIVYSDSSYKTSHGFRLLAVDGSQVILPNEENIRNEFGSIKIKNQCKNTPGEYSVSTVSVLYDVLNNIGIDAIMGHSKAYEVDLALNHLRALEENNLRLGNELFIFDRGYPSYFLFASLISKRGQGVARCSKGSFEAAQSMFKSQIKSKVVTITPNSTIAKEIRDLGLPSKIQIRFIRVVLSTGEVEVLATSLLDDIQYPSEIFKEIYHLRWGIETFFDIIKNRLNLENFSGKTAESVKQDFFSTILITGLEAILIEDAQEELDSRTPYNRQPLKVNKSVSFNAIKNHVIELFCYEDDLDLLLDKLTNQLRWRYSWTRMVIEGLTGS